MLFNNCEPLTDVHPVWVQMEAHTEIQAEGSWGNGSASNMLAEQT